MIYISTGGFKFNTCYEAIHKLKEKGIFSIELSGGKYELKQEYKLKLLHKNNRNLKFQVHNYFPPPKDPFVFNLGSLDLNIANKSINHAINSIKLAHSLGGKYYSFHSGFLLDPKVNELGETIKKQHLYNREEAIIQFIDRVKKISEVAKELGIILLIENNVLSLKNFNQFDKNILMMVDSHECLEIMEKINRNNVKMVIDLAHLKVSANTLKFDPKAFLLDIEKWIGAYHFSDNNGFSDDNEPFTKNSWFWPYIKKNLDYYSIEVYNVEIEELLKQKEIAINMIYN